MAMLLLTCLILDGFMYCQIIAKIGKKNHRRVFSCFFSISVSDERSYLSPSVKAVNIIIGHIYCYLKDFSQNKEAWVLAIFILWAFIRAYISLNCGYFFM